MSQQLLTACIFGNLNQVRQLLTHSPHLVDFQDSNQENALIFACKRAQLHVIDYLLTSKELKQKANIHAVDSYGRNVLMWACREGRLDIFQYLLSDKLEEKSDIEHLDYTSKNIFIYACYYGSLDIVHYLYTSEDLKQRLDFYHRDEQGYNALMWACSKKQLDIAYYLIVEQAFHVDDKTMTWLFDNGQRQCLAMIQMRDLGQKLNNASHTDKVIKQRKI